MFPIRSLTPQQATGNALAAGFKMKSGWKELLQEAF
jgi:hypothetical protein